MGCFDNQLTSLDVSNNTALNILFCQNNSLTSIDVSQNTALTNLSCLNTNLTILDVSQNTALSNLDCSYNQLTSLNVSQNALTHLDCSDNHLTSLDVTNGINPSLVDFTTTNNPNLTCIDVSDPQLADFYWTNIDPQHFFSMFCGTSNIQEHSANKELLKITDLLGRETKQTKQPLLYLYDDGTVEKKLIIK